MLTRMLAHERMTGGGAADLWRAESELRHRRRVALEGLERCFAAGSAPEGLEGPLDGRLVTTTLGFGLDFPFEAIARAYLPWRGKTFRPDDAEGRNRFVRSSRPFFRVLWPRYRDHVTHDDGGFTAFRFDTSVGSSVTHPGVSVLRIDYDHPACPWPVRSILDELVHVGEGQHLGQALVRVGGRFRRVAWFALELDRA